jgi:hypothetical protein
MLSPKAMNRVALRCGARVTATVNVHVVGRPPLSRAVHVTVVDPTGKDEFDAGLQLVVTGCTPPFVVGSGNGTATGPPSGDAVVTLSGHVIAGPGGGGPVGEPPQATRAIEMATRDARVAARAAAPAAPSVSIAGC